ncbi:DUF5682 family protein, partial [Burkholderia sp. Ac-20384]|uniref:DUF5682 family protein n=1 Tax=Burkholderia sp. Ac-20384 TaxID=2703902 RepID=UPI001F120857
QEAAPDPVPIRKLAEHHEVGVGIGHREAQATQPVDGRIALGLAAHASTGDGQPVAGIDDAMALLQAMPAAALGDALGGLLALARETLASAPAFVAGMDATVRALDDADFVLALPGLRGAFAWLPPQERGRLADQVLALHQATHLSRRVLTERHAEDASPEAVAHATRIEAQVLGRLRRWGLTPDPEAS